MEGLKCEECNKIFSSNIKQKFCSYKCSNKVTGRKRSEKIWSVDNINLLIDVFPKSSYDEIKKHFPKKTHRSIWHKAYRLGLRRDRKYYEVKKKACDVVIPILSEANLGYIAGLFDGEGCITIYYDKSRVTYGKLNPMFRISNTYRSVLDEIKTLTGFGKIDNGRITGIPSKYGIKKPVYTFKVYRLYEMLGLIKILLPYLRIKRKQAEIFIEFINIQLSKTTVVDRDKKTGRFIKITYDELSKRECDIYYEIRKLNTGRDLIRTVIPTSIK